MTGLACFVIYPSRIEDLYRLHLPAERKLFAVVGTVTLSRVDYENFITDLTVERQFLKDRAHLCGIGEDGVYSCLFVRHRGVKRGVLVLPNGMGYVIRAAYLADEV